MSCEFHPDALAEYQEAARYYAGCQAGLELCFMASVETAVQQIAAAPDRWRILERDVRRCLTKVFPYAILIVSRGIGDNDFRMSPNRLCVSSTFGAWTGCGCERTMWP